MSKYLKTLLIKNRKATTIIGGTIITTGVLFAGYFGVTKAKQAKIEKEALELELKEQEEKELKEAQAKARLEYLANTKIAYLTFDDGPHPTNTEKVLEVLKNNDIKATFFMIGDMASRNPELVKKVKEAGHTIANHTTNHKYKYRTSEEFLADIQDTDNKISEALGEPHKSLFVRVPGGSMGKKLEKETLKNAGYIDTNWTALNGDSEKGGRVNSEYIIKRIKDTVGDEQHEVVLMHDIKSVTTENLQKIIDTIKEKGYVFEPLQEDSPINF